MNIDQIAISLIITLTFCLFIYGKWRYDVVSVTALLVLIITDKLLGGDSSSLIIDYNKK